ncbi:hypothetical protein [Frateuria defendens]|uniref:hypothetical protein n=1 Tax=Frateuria defendens TaxID=2219559 RepID=UPI00066FFA0F|nr:hypothetical protein [Frateuria defendens]
MMLRRSLTTAALALSLCACGGGQDTHRPVPLGSLVVPNSAPWLNVEPVSFDLPVRGVDDTVVLSPSPSVAEALQAQLRRALQPSYFTDLVVGCGRPKAELRVEQQDDAPSRARLDLTVHCTINARGFTTNADYRAQPVLPVPADKDYGKLFVTLLDRASKDIAARLDADVRSSGARLRGA